MADKINLEQLWRERHAELSKTLNCALRREYLDGVLIKGLTDSLISLESTMIAYMPRMVEVEKGL